MVALGSVTGRRLAATLALVATLVLVDAGPAWAVSQPGRQSTGYGSTATYVSAGATRYESGRADDGSRVWWWVPSTLRDGATAPVVIYLHGFSLTDPAPYQPHIDHLTRQGYLVVYPQFNLTGFGIFSDNNQNTMLTRAVNSTNVALAAIGSRAGPLHLFGHSLGGLLAASWQGRGGAAGQSLTLANPSTGGGAPSFVSITPINWQQAAPSNTARTMILTGDDDTIAAPSESVALFDAMTGAPARIVYQAHTDAHGSPELTADHLSPIQSSGGIPNFLLSFFGGDAEQDAMDWRYYWAALDANLDGNRTAAFDLGTWSDGQAVASPTVLAADVPAAPGAPLVSATAGNGQVSLSWVPPGADGGRPLTGFRIDRDGTPLHTTADAVTTGYTDTGLANGVPHTYVVRAVNAVGPGAASNELTVTPRTLPGPPTDLAVSPDGADVQVSWSGPLADGGSPVTGYRVARDGATVATTGATTSFRDPQVVCGPHAYAVAAINAAGEGPLSAVSSTVVTCRPDAEIASAANGPFVGDGVYSRTVTADQTRSAGVARNATRTYFVRLGNDGGAAASFRLRGVASGSPGYTVAYLRGRTDITTEVRAGTYELADLAPGATVVIKVKVTAGPGSARGSTRAVDLTMRSLEGPVLRDMVRARATRT